MDDLQQINVGDAANDGTGDDLRTASQKTNANVTAIQSEIEDRLRFVTATASWTPSSLDDGEFDYAELAVTDAVLGQQVLVSAGSDLPIGVLLFGAVVSADLVRVTAFNLSGGTVALGNRTVRIDCLLP